MLRHKDPHLADRGPFTEKSPLAEDQEPDENGVDWRMRATAAETELAIAREQESDGDALAGWALTR